MDMDKSEKRFEQDIETFLHQGYAKKNDETVFRQSIFLGK